MSAIYSLVHQIYVGSLLWTRHQAKSSVITHYSLMIEILDSKLTVSDPKSIYTVEIVWIKNIFKYYVYL